MNVLFIGPLPDPLTGQSLACQVFYEELKKTNNVEVVNMSKSGFKQGIDSIRILQVLKIVWAVWKKKKEKDLIYFTISESYAGNIKDILIYAVCYSQLSKMLIHLHGGAGMQGIMLGNNLILKLLNNFFLNKIGGIIILGARHEVIYTSIANKNKIHIVPNFAQDYLFTTEGEVARKFENIRPLKILFLSNLLPGKGFIELAQAFCALDDATKTLIEIDFAGGIESNEQHTYFLELINGYSQIRYHGVVKGEQKKKLFSDAHVFCLPTYYPYEGQPISILEAYASGCVVITTDHSGIYDIFEEGINGYGVTKQSYPSLKSAIERAIESPDILCSIANNNLSTAQTHYRADNYNINLKTVIHKLFSL